jgi:glutaconate CoA-transferase subunit B
VRGSRQEEICPGVTPLEWMIVVASRQIRDGEVLLVGTQWPIVAALLAKRTCAPHAVICFEGGVILEDLPPRVPLWTADPVVGSSSSFQGDSLDILGAVLHAGVADRALLTAAAVDRYGNLATTCVGAYESPEMRFGGSGGACDFACLAKETMVIIEHERHRFPAQVDFITSPGFLHGDGSRYDAGLRQGTGPQCVVTTLGLFTFDERGEMVLSGTREGVCVEEVAAEVQWPLRVASGCRPLAGPTPEEIGILREVIDPQGVYLRNRKGAPHNRPSTQGTGTP